MKWIVFATLSAVFYLAHDYILKVISQKMNPVLSGIILSVFSFIFLAVYFGIQIASGEKYDRIKADDFKVLALAGLFLALASVFFIRTFEYAAPFSIAIPYIYVVMIVLGVVSGAVFFKESIQWMQILGLILCCVGLFLVAKN